MNGQNRDWPDTLSTNDTEALWVKLYKLVSRHSSIRNLFESERVSRDRLKDLYADLTQDLFLRLFEKDRWQFYLRSGYTNDRVEHELYHIEIPNMVFQLLRQRYPESSRLVRRISNLLRTSSHFQYYPQPVFSLGGSNGSKSASPSQKLALRVYGLKNWELDKPVMSRHSFSEPIKEVRFRRRETKRTGRGSGSQIIISNDELRELMVEVFEAINSPTDVRTVRSLVMSKVAVEDSQFISIDAELVPRSNAEAELLKVDLADQRATPEELLLEKELMSEVDAKLTELFKRMREAVRNKPHRYKTLLMVVWHCYFDPSSPSQTSVASLMGISPSLVTHYRKIFDGVVQGLRVSNEQHALFGTALSNGLSAMVTELAETQTHQSGAQDDTQCLTAGQKQHGVKKSMTTVDSCAGGGFAYYQSGTMGS